jgi:hypothetical protein
VFRPVLPEAPVRADRLGFLQQLLIVPGQQFEVLPGHNCSDGLAPSTDAPAGFAGNCFGVIGPEAKTCIWLVKDDNSLYVDRNGDGDLTATGYRATFNEPYQRWESGDIHGPDGKSCYKVSLRRFENPASGVQLSIHQNSGERDYIADDPDAEPLLFGARPSQAPVAHIGGALATDLGYSIRGKNSKSLVLRVRVGTRGHGQGAFAGLVLAGKGFPVAEIEFPPREFGGVPVVVKKALKGR